MSITSIGQSISKGFAKGYSAFVNSKPLKAIAKQYEKDNLSVISGVAVTSIVLKDALGCYMYVNQSLNNKKIPEEKRAFVAALDLANGGLMIAAQLLAFFTINNKKVQEKLFNRFFGKALNRSFRKGIISKLNGNSEYSKLGKKLLNDNFEAFKKTAASAFSMVTSLVASTIIAKRMVVPFIATPLATYLKDNYMNKDGGKKSNPVDEKNQVCQKYLQQNLQKYNIDNFAKAKA